ncbi:CU044_5270 family protein [Actinocorallia sp. B10E7]|uniref:CU044_5270 family protein n=1 Tax=Actinocorallia sp. B10E7 TaxID=3153558 RepID=UPI00325C53A4
MSSLPPRRDLPDLQTRRNHLMSEIGAPPRKRSRRLLFGGLLAGTAVAVAGGVAATVLVASPGDPVRSPSVRPSAVPLQLISATEVLERASRAASDEPELAPKPDHYLYFESKIHEAKGRGTFYRKTWFAVDAKRAGLLRTTDKSFSDQPQPGHPGWGEIWLCNGFPQKVDVNNPPDDDPGCRSDSKYRSDLPTTPDAMYRWLYDNSQGDNPPDVQAFDTVGSAIRESYVPPKARAALFAAASRIPGVTVTRDVTDLAGRKGVAVGQSWHGTRQELIFDAVTYRFLGERTIIDYETSFDPPGGETNPAVPVPWTPPAKMKARFKHGEVTYESTELRVALVPKVGQEP